MIIGRIPEYFSAMGVLKQMEEKENRLAMGKANHSTEPLTKHEFYQGLLTLCTTIQFTIWLSKGITGYLFLGVLICFILASVLLVWDAINS